MKINYKITCGRGELWAKGTIDMPENFTNRELKDEMLRRLEGDFILEAKEETEEVFRRL